MIKPTNIARLQPNDKVEKGKEVRKDKPNIWPTTEIIGLVGVILCIVIIVLNTSNLVNGPINQWKMVLYSGVAGYAFFSLSKGKKPNLGIVFAAIILFAATVVFFDTTPHSAWQTHLSKQLTTKTIAPQTSLPRNVGWASSVISTTPTKLLKVYNGDVFEYENAQSGFWVREGKKGESYFHNRTNQSCNRKQFSFFNLPTNGVEIYIYRDKNTSKNDFQIKFRVGNF